MSLSNDWQKRMMTFADNLNNQEKELTTSGFVTLLCEQLVQSKNAKNLKP